MKEVLNSFPKVTVPSIETLDRYNHNVSEAHTFWTYFSYLHYYPQKKVFNKTCILYQLIQEIPLPINLSGSLSETNCLVTFCSFFTISFTFFKVNPIFLCFSSQFPTYSFSSCLPLLDTFFCFSSTRHLTYRNTKLRLMGCYISNCFWYRCIVQGLMSFRS